MFTARCIRQSALYFFFSFSLSLSHSIPHICMRTHTQNLQKSNWIKEYTNGEINQRTYVFNVCCISFFPLASSSSSYSSSYFFFFFHSILFFFLSLANTVTLVMLLFCSDGSTSIFVIRMIAFACFIIVSVPRERTIFIFLSFISLCLILCRERLKANNAI